MCRKSYEITDEMEKESTNLGEFILLVLTSNIFFVGLPLSKIFVVGWLCDGSTNYYREYCDGFFKVDELLVLFFRFKIKDWQTIGFLLRETNNWFCCSFVNNHFLLVHIFYVNFEQTQPVMSSWFWPDNKGLWEITLTKLLKKFK